MKKGRCTTNEYLNSPQRIHNPQSSTPVREASYIDPNSVNMFLAIWVSTVVCLSLGPTSAKLFLDRLDQVDSNIVSSQRLQHLSPQKLGSIKEDHWVQIAEAPPTVISTRLGERVEIECEAIGSPAPVITWLRGERPVTQQIRKLQHNHLQAERAGLAKLKSRLVLDCVTRKHEGFYTCAAQSGDTTAKAKPTLILIEGIGPGDLELCSGSQIQPPRIVEWTSTAMETMGLDVVLPCTATGSPAPTIYWVDPQGTVLTSVHHGVSENGDLTIPRLEWAHMGEYTCVAENSEGRDTATTFVYPVLWYQHDKNKMNFICWERAILTPVLKWFK